MNEPDADTALVTRVAHGDAQAVRALVGRQLPRLPALAQRLRDARQEAAPPILAAREGRQEVLRLIAAPQLDAAAVSAALARTREADAALRTRVEACVVEFAATLSPEDRQKLSSGLARRTPLNAPTGAAAPAKR